MFGPMDMLAAENYPSLEGGSARKFLTRPIPFAGIVKTLTVGVLVGSSISNTDILVELQESMDGENWKKVADIWGGGTAAITTAGFHVEHVNDDGTDAFGPIARLQVTVQKNTGTAQVVAPILWCKVSGKPF